MCKISLLEFEFEAEELECGNEGVELGVREGCDRMGSAEAEVVNVWYRSTEVGSDGVWKVRGPVGARGTGVGIDPGCL